jgi:glycosyltransferase involved in cell wall biosynthesis
MTRPVLYTGDIFRLQARGGITRYFIELIPRLGRTTRIVAGLHQSKVIRARGLDAEASAYMAPFKTSPRFRAAVNAVIDAYLLHGDVPTILHPTYYRDPGRLPSLPMVLTVHDMAHERFPAMFRRRWWNSEDPAHWKKAIVDRADRVICVSESTRRDLIELFRVDEKKTSVIHHGTRVWGTVPSEEIPGLDRPFFLWVGERHTYKNFAGAVRAWSSSKAAAGTAILCAGGPPLGAGERLLLETLGVAGRVGRIVLSEAGLRWAYERAAGLLYVSRCEGFGLPLLEAMSLGCPVVTSNTSSMPEVAGDAAIYVDPTDTASIAEGIDRCLSEGRDFTKTQRLTARAALFSWDKCAAAHEAVYRELD